MALNDWAFAFAMGWGMAGGAIIERVRPTSSAQTFSRQALRYFVFGSVGAAIGAMLVHLTDFVTGSLL